MKRKLCLLLVCMMLFCCSGCAPIGTALDYLLGNEQIAAAEALPHVGFSNGDVLETTMILTADEFSDLPIDYDDYRASLFYDQLDPNEQLIYRAYEYALEHQYTNILIDTALVTDSEDLYALLEYLSLDSPLLEQNLRYEMGTFTTYYPVSIFDLYTREACFEGYYMTIHNFEASLWEKKLQAIEKAREILQSISFEGAADDFRKAEIIYRYVGEHMIYDDYESGNDEYTVQPYLYDALVNGRSHCDGYANAISLLMNMSDLYCAEKQFTKEETGENGHTWNYALIDGIWTNIDGTYTDWIPDTECTLFAGPGFCFSDLFQQDTPDYADHYAVAAYDIAIEPDAHLASAADPAFVDEAIVGYCQHDGGWAYIVVDRYDEQDIDDSMQDIANELQTRIYYASFELMDDRTAVLIYNGDLYGE